MKIEKIGFEKFSQISSRDKAYQSNDSTLEPFYKYKFEYNEFKNAISDRKRFPIDRKLLINQLNKQYDGIEVSKKTAKNIQKLASENTFTIITAHQPSLFTGPLYYILKICSTINITENLKKDFPENDFVPVFILGAEDHDFEEINHTQIFNKKIEWNNDESGSVGRMSKTNLDQAIEQLFDILGDNANANELKEIVAFAQKESYSYGEFSFLLIHKLFDRFGLIIANFDNKAFKNAFKPYIKQEIFENTSKPLVELEQKRLIEAGFSDQAYAREINFFYLSDGSRSRIEKQGDVFKVLDTDLSFTMDEMYDEIDRFPERFSPNVIMRPIFQEIIMPNLAYVGGGGELAYWMERKSQFKEFNVFFPMLVRRNSALWVNKRNKKQMDSLELGIQDFLADTEQLIKSYALDQTEHEIDFSSEYSKITEAYNDISHKAVDIDKTLEAKVEAMKTNHINNLEKLHQRLIRTIKQNQETTLNKIRKTKDLLFPGEGLQERQVNFMEFYLSNGKDMIDYLTEVCNPFEKELLVIYED